MNFDEFTKAIHPKLLFIENIFFFNFIILTFRFNIFQIFFSFEILLKILNLSCRKVMWNTFNVSLMIDIGTENPEDLDAYKASHLFV